MTKGQRISLQAEWWPAACRAQGWKPNDRDLRLRVCAWCVSLDDPSQLELLNAINSDATPARVLVSTNDLDNKQDIDRVKSCLLMLADDVKRTQEVGKPEIGSARRKRDVIRSHVKCLGVVGDDDASRAPKKFLAALVQDMFNRGRPGLSIRDLDDQPNARRDGTLGPSDLDRLVMRMAQIVNDKRKVIVPAMTIHDMKIKAGVFCDCARCRRARVGVRPEPVVIAEEDWSDLEPELERAGAECGIVQEDSNGDPVW